MRDNRRRTFSLEEALLWIIDSYFSQKQRFKVKMLWWRICFSQRHSFSLQKMLTDGLEWCGLLVDYCDVFISCLDSHSDGTHSLQRIHWWDSDGKINFSKSLPVIKQTHLYFWLHLQPLRSRTLRSRRHRVQWRRNWPAGRTRTSRSSSSTARISASSARPDSTPTSSWSLTWLSTRTSRYRTQTQTFTESKLCNYIIK